MLLTRLAAAVATALFALPCAAQTAVPRQLPAPPITATPRKVPGVEPARTRLVLVSKTVNAITDDAAWFEKNYLILPDYRLEGMEATSGAPLEAGAQATSDGLPVRRALPTASGKRILFLYGGDEYGSVTRLLCADKATRTPAYAFDFANFRSPANGAISGTTQPLVFAAEDASGRVLYAAHAVNGYAKEVRGQTGYVSAIETKTGKLLWRSAPMTQNANTFLLADSVLICGYGFTDEPDYLRLLDTRTGRVVQTVPLKSGPSYILRRENRVYVRCYDTDYVFALKP